MDKPSYYLIQIYDEAVPLAAYSDNKLFVCMVITMILIILGLTVISYLAGCRQCQRRIAELGDNGKGQSCWNLQRLQKRISDLELQKAGDIFSEISEPFAKGA